MLKSITSLIILMVATFLLPSCTLINPGTFAITSPAAGLQFRSNVIKVEGSVVRNTSAVTVNGQEARIADGKFLAFVEIPEGASVIEASAQVKGKTVKDEINVSFRPPLAVYVHGFTDQTSIEGGDISLTVEGSVSKPEAAVTVNGEPVVVEPDGNFSAQITVSLSIRDIVAVATLGEDKDIYRYAVFNSGGLFGIPPFGGSAPNFPIVEFPDSVSLRSGSEVVFEWTYEPKQSIRTPTVFTLRATGSRGTTPGEFPLPDGLDVMPFPASFTAYPNCFYALSFVIVAQDGLKPGNYEVRLHLPTIPGAGVQVEVR